MREKYIMINLLEPSVLVKRWPDLSVIKEAALVSYRTESKKTPKEFYDMLVKNGHVSVLEHTVISFKVVCSRACSHQLVRHRIGCSYTQES